MYIVKAITSDLDNSANCDLAETLTSKDFEDLLIPDAKYAGEVSRVKRSTSSGEGRVRFQHPDLIHKMDTSKYKVKHVSRKDCEEYLLHIHYAKRWPMMTYAFGLFYNDELCGVITYGETTSAPLRINIAGPAFEHHIIELSRLCLKYNRKNEASFLVGRSIKLLPKNKIIVSFADTGQEHIGCVYQATNFIYTGMSLAHKQVRLRGREDAHELTILREFKGQPNLLKCLREKYGDRIYHEWTTRKHRYIYFYGDRKFKKEARAALKHKSRPFPKRTDTIQELDDLFNRQDNIDNCELACTLSSKDFVGML